MELEREQRIEGKLDELLQNFVPRDELERRFDRLSDKLDGKLDTVLERQAEYAQQLAVVETRVAALDAFDARLLDVEDVAALQRDRKESRGWFWPMLANGVGVAISAAIATVTLLVGGHHHG